MKLTIKPTMLSLAIALGSLLSDAAAEIPTAYYNTVNGKTEGELKTALSDLIYNHLSVSYSNLPSYFKRTDNLPNTNYWWDMYSDMEVNMNITFGTYMNREHAFPKSWWGGLTTTPAYTDLNHLYPSEKDANMAKSNYPLGEVSTATFDNGVVKVGYPVTGQGGGAGSVFEPNEEYIGDFARTYFYMVTCYQGLSWTPKYMYMLEQNDYPTLKDWAIDLLLRWHRADPVSEKEINRNEVVYSIQNNRNPFIDYPELAEYIWGNKRGQKFYTGNDTPTGDPQLITPVQDMALDFEQVAIGKSAVSYLNFRGANLTGSLSLAVTGASKSMFALSTKSIPASNVNAEAGYQLKVVYTPTSTGEHTARLIVSDGGITGSLGVQLIGECLPVPTLSTLTALSASDITPTSYVANWDAPSEVVDYYIVTRTRYTNGSSSSEQLMAESNSLLIDDFGDSDSESYNVRSWRLGYQSQPSNEVFVTHASVQGIESDIPFGWAYMPGGVRFVTAAPVTSVSIYDLAGRLVMELPEVTNNQELLLPYGGYVIASPALTTPLRLLVRP